MQSSFSSLSSSRLALLLSLLLASLSSVTAAQSDDASDDIAGMASWLFAIMIVLVVIFVACLPFIICCACGYGCAECCREDQLPPQFVAVMPNFMFAHPPPTQPAVAMTAVPVRMGSETASPTSSGVGYINLPASPSASAFTLAPPLPPRPDSAQSFQQLLDAKCPQRIPDIVAHFILTSPSISHVAAAEWLTQDTPYHRQTLTLLLIQQNYSGLGVDHALRLLLNQLDPRSHTAVARVLQIFTGVYHTRNAAAWAGGMEAVLTIATALMAVWRGLLDCETFVADGVAMNEPKLTHEALRQMYETMAAQRP